MPRQHVISSKGDGSCSSQNCLETYFPCLYPQIKKSDFSSYENCIPALKVLAQNTVNSNGLQKELPLHSADTSYVVTDCPTGKNSRDSELNLTLCGNRFGDESVVSEKISRRKPTEFYRIMQNDMKIERNRLDTFVNVWPLGYISPSDLAAVGFFYLQSGDKVQCAFCHGIIIDWAPGDDPLTEHCLHFPLCPFLMKRDVGNVPLSGRNPIMSQDSNSYPEKLGPFRQSLSSSTTASSLSRPKFPKMESKEKRLCTFHSWRCLAVKPDDLADAGFFSTGTSDIVACFSCGGTLGHWDLGDDPWLEHKKHFPQCAYLKSVRHSTVKSSSNGFQGGVSKPVHASPSADINELMKSTVCVEASKIFSEKLVKEALEKQLKKKGQGFRNLEELCSIILEMQDEKSQRKVDGEVESQTQNESATGPTSDRHMCKICYDKEMGVVFLPCGHMMACPECALSVTTCPLCRKTIENAVRAYIS